MKRALSAEELYDAVAEIRNLKRGFVTNFYPDVRKHTLWTARGDMFCERIGDTWFFVKKNGDFLNLFYNTTDTQTLTADLNRFCRLYPNNSIVIDVVTGKAQAPSQRELFQEAGFEEIASLVRMSRATVLEPKADADGIAFADTADALQVYELLCRYFDPQTEQIPYPEELEELARENHILIASGEKGIKGFVVFEKNKTTQYLRYWFVLPEYRDQKVGGTLLRRFFYEGNDTRRQIFWVMRSNDNAIVRYRHYGFDEEPLLDFVFYRRTNERDRAGIARTNVASSDRAEDNGTGYEKS